MLQGKDLFQSKLTAANILLRVSDSQIFAKYICEVGNAVSSPFRVDKKQSCGFYTDSYGRLVLHDFATAKKWNCFEAIMEKFSITFSAMLHKINKDLDLRLGTLNPLPVNTELTLQVIENQKPELEITYNIKPYEKHEIEYWANYGVSPETLLKYGVYCVKSVKFNDSG